MPSALPPGCVQKFRLIEHGVAVDLEIAIELRHLRDDHRRVGVSGLDVDRVRTGGLDLGKEWGEVFRLSGNKRLSRDDGATHLLDNAGPCLENVDAIVVVGVNNGEILAAVLDHAAGNEVALKGCNCAHSKDVVACQRHVDLTCLRGDHGDADLLEDGNGGHGRGRGLAADERRGYRRDRQ